jgi:hypothetical protein
MMKNLMGYYLKSFAVFLEIREAVAKKFSNINQFFLIYNKTLTIKRNEGIVYDSIN